MEASPDPAAPLDLRTCFEFLPSGGQALTQDAGRYCLTVDTQNYVYIPPRRPEALGRQISALKMLPQFSIVVPVFNTPTEIFRSMIASVQAQWYPYWELILVDDCSTTLNVVEITQSIAGIDDRIRIRRLTQNKRISDATNIGLAEASGDYVVFLDHDDELTPDCLFELAKAIDCDNPDYLYSDEDKITRSGTFAEPFFKPDWSPDTLMTMMYTAHVSCVRRELLLKVGFLRKEFDGSQDWDLILRVTEWSQKVTHIPKVLYHWRVIPGSAADVVDAKPYAIDSGKRAREDALRRRGLDGTVQPVIGASSRFRIVYAVQGSPKVSIVIPSKNNAPVLKRCVESILYATRYRNCEFIILDNGSTERATLTYLSELHEQVHTTVIRDAAPFNWSALNNTGARNSTGDLLLFLNDDTEVVTPGWLEEMIGYAQLDHIGAVGAKLLYPPGEIVQHNGVVSIYSGPGHSFGRSSRNAPGPFERNLVEFNCIAVTGACLMISKEKFEHLNGFNEAFPVAYNDVDFCFRAIEHGWFNLVCQGAELLHHESLSRGSDFLDSAKMRRLTSDRKRLYQVHPDFFLADPFYNVNLHPNDVQYGVPH